MPPLDGVIKHRATALQDVFDPLVHQWPFGGIPVAVGAHLDRPQIADKLLGVDSPEMRCRMRSVRLIQESQEMLGRRSVPVDCLQ